MYPRVTTVAFVFLEFGKRRAKYLIKHQTQFVLVVSQNSCVRVRKTNAMDPTAIYRHVSGRVVFRLDNRRFDKQIKRM